MQRVAYIFVLALSLYAQPLPKGFVNLQNVAPQVHYDIRYFGNHNFVGKRITGYKAPKCILTEQTAEALTQVETQLLPMGLTLKVYDCYRPQRAVNEFVRWAREPDNTAMKEEFYPDIPKKRLFKEGYIAAKSGHSRGSTVDLTIVALHSKNTPWSSEEKPIPCTKPYGIRYSDNSLDMGTGFDCFSLLSHPFNPTLSPQAKANRLLLRTLMIDAGFRALDEEWWHFTLKNEPYPNTYFDFPIE